MLAQRQAQVLSLKLGKTDTTRDIPSRPLPYGSEGVISPTYVSQTAHTSSSARNMSNTTSKGPATLDEDRTPTAESVPSNSRTGNEVSSAFPSFYSNFPNIIPTTCSQAVESVDTSVEGMAIEEPSYKGGGTVWDKDEDVRGLDETTRLGASEEELDVLMN